MAKSVAHVTGQHTDADGDDATDREVATSVTDVDPTVPDGDGDGSINSPLDDSGRPTVADATDCEVATSVTDVDPTAFDGDVTVASHNSSICPFVDAVVTSSGSPISYRTEALPVDCIATTEHVDRNVAGTYIANIASETVSCSVSNKSRTSHRSTASKSCKLSPIKTAKGLVVKAAFGCSSSPIKRARRGMRTEVDIGKSVDKVQTRASVVGRSSVSGHSINRCSPQKMKTAIRRPQLKMKSTSATVTRPPESGCKGRDKSILHVTKTSSGSARSSFERLPKDTQSVRKHRKSVQTMDSDHVGKKVTSAHSCLKRRKGSPGAGPSKRMCRGVTKGILQAQKKNNTSVDGQQKTVRRKRGHWSDVETDDDEGKDPGHDRITRNAKSDKVNMTKNKKGPPCKGWMLLRESKLTDSDDSDDDSDYIPGEDLDADSDDSCKTVTKTTRLAAEVLTISKSPDRRRSGNTLMLLNRLQNKENTEDGCSDTDTENEEQDSSSNTGSEVDNTTEFDDLPEEMDTDNDVSVIASPQIWFPPVGKHKVFVSNYPTAADSNTCNRPIDFFRLFMDDELVDLMVVQTNLNARQSLGRTQQSSESRLNRWTDTNKEEMESFIGLLLWMGLVKMPSIKSYWKRSRLFCNSIAPLIMPRNRFELILRMWHFADNAEANDDDRLHKVRNLVRLLVAKFQQAKVPGEHLVVDETMIPFRGRLKFRQYLPGKSHKYGIKVFKLCDRSGYTYNLDIYSGKGDGQATDVVMKLCEPYLEGGRTMCTDNYYTSLPLADCLLNKKTHLVGTLRGNRKGLPKEVSDARLQRGEVIARENASGTVVLKWKDKRDVLLLTTRHTDKMVDTGKKRRSGESVIKPEAILYYNSSKQGIDVSDQMAAYQSPIRKSIRWYHKVAAELLLGTSLVNAHLLYNAHCMNTGNVDDTLQIADLRGKIIESLLNCGSRGSAAEQPKVHFLRATQSKEGGKRSDRRKRRYCIGCYNQYTQLSGREVAKRKAKKVVTECAGCPGNPRFCYECFPKYHPV